MDKPLSLGSRLNSSRPYIILKLAIYIIIPVVLLILPADFFDGGESICLSVQLLDVECFACGLTRGIMHLIHFNFTEAFYYNMLSFIVFPLCAYLWARWFWEDWTRLKQMT